MAAAPKSITTAVDHCVICTEAMIPGQESVEARIKRLVCAHSYHEACINEWLNQSQTCPLCRAPVAQENEAPDEPPGPPPPRRAWLIFRVAAWAQRLFREMVDYIGEFPQDVAEQEQPQIHVIDGTQGKNPGKPTS